MILNRDSAKTMTVMNVVGVTVMAAVLDLFTHCGAGIEDYLGSVDPVHHPVLIINTPCQYIAGTTY